jgi:hypothetical protein
MIPYLGYCWNINTIFIPINKYINPKILSPNLFFLFLIITIIKATNIDTKERNNHKG